MLGKTNLLYPKGKATRKKNLFHNFLFMNGVRYEYERLYPFEGDDPLRKSYRPDFYLCDYDIYLEHFGVSKDFKCPHLSPVEEEKYLEGIKWKRDFHQRNGTKLLETYSYYTSEGVSRNFLWRVVAHSLPCRRNSATIRR